MKIQYYYSSKTKNWGAKDETREYEWHNRAPIGTEEVWNFVSEDKTAQYSPQRHKVQIIDDSEDVLFRCQFVAAYLRCCGMREIGDIWLEETNGKQTVEFFYEKMQANNSGGYRAFGCILYTEVKDGDVNLYPEGSRFCELWPGAKTASDWWYNPNSGNWCRNWTLTINQELANPAKDDEEPDDWDEEDY